MGLFDFIPTFDEVVEFIACRLTDHEWGNVQGALVCRDCGKVKGD